MWDLTRDVKCTTCSLLENAVTPTTSIPVSRYLVTTLCHFVLDVDRGSRALAHHQPVCGRVTPALLFK